MGFIDLGLNGVAGDGLINLSRPAGINQNTTGSGTDEKTAKVEGESGNQIPLIGTSSSFNPFYIFRYSNFAAGASANTTGNYDLAGHRLLYDTARYLGDSAARLRNAAREEVQDPTATKIVKWANDQAVKGANHKGPLYPYPYSLSDFYHCKWYGQIPNNRLLTLRRYPIPVEDNLAVAAEKLPLVPIAQAVTWWGEGTGNTLGKILAMTWGFNWTTYPKKGEEIQDVQGNEIQLEQIFDVLGIKTENEPARQLLITAFANQSGTNPYALSGFDKVLQENIKKQYEDGAYANRIRGPLNVITETQQRDRGYTFSSGTGGIVLTFEYKLRTLGTPRLNPKIVMLDLISNFLSLTYNRASFWGGGYRYFQQTGPLLPGFNTDSMEKGDYANASKDLLSMLTQMVAGGGSDLKDFINKAISAAGSSVTDTQGIEDIFKTAVESRVGQNLLASRLGALHQTPLVMRALADGRAVGEWHLMVGNPMDPAAVIGNLILKSTSIDFGEELGADDFPTEVKFTVTLDHGRPRAKQDIESIFNHGGGDMFFTALEPPASTRNSFGEYNSQRALDTNGTLPTATNGAAAAQRSQSTATLSDNGATANAENLANYFKKDVERRYGDGFAKSPILTDYFLKLYTND
jgi:hypothetical protein